MDRVILQSLEAAYQDGAMIRENAPTISHEALASCRAIITDEWLDFMGERYRRLAIRYWTGVEFQKYLFYPEVLQREADKKRCYKAFRLVHFQGECVATTTN